MRILIAIGGSSHSEVALRFGAQLVRRTHETPTLLTVIRHESERPQADEILSRATLFLDPMVVKARTKTRVGHPAEEIICEAEEGNYSLVIVGDRQEHRLVTRFRLGSTAVRVVEHAPCPVIVAKGKIGWTGRMLLCDSGVEAPSLLNRFTAQLAGLITGEEETTILHVMSQISAGPGVNGESLRADVEKLIEKQAPEGKLLERDIRILEGYSIHPIPKVRHGLVVDEILAEARDGDYDMVVIGTHRGEGWRRILLDDLAHQIIAQVDRPILIVR